MIVAICEASERKSKEEKTVVVTSDRLLGTWKGPKGVLVTLQFTEKKLKVVISSDEGVGAKSTTLEWDYIIDPKKNVVIMHPLDHGGGLGEATLKTEGKLSVLMVELLPHLKNPLENVIFTLVEDKKTSND